MVAADTLLTATITSGSLVCPDEYAIYTPLSKWGYEHKTMCYGQGEYAQDDDEDGFFTVFCVYADQRFLG